MLKIAVPRLYEPMTAYDFLLGPLTRLVREEPKRMRMCDWSTPIENLHQSDRPICGTVACIGGWTEFLVHGQLATAFGRSRREHCAGRVLGLTEDQRDELFYSECVGDADQGTPEHAEHVIAHIAAFCDRHGDQLKATMVVPT